LTVTSVSDPAGGSTAIMAGNVQYTPDANVYGPDSFTYDVCDNGVPVRCATGTVNVTVAPVNDAPRAHPDYATATEDTPLVVNVLGNDDAGPNEATQVLTIASVSKPLRGAAAIVAGKVLYTPDANAFGADVFTYTVCDDGVPVKCVSSVVGVGVLPVNDPPTISHTTDKSTKKNKAVSFSVTVGDVDNAASSLTVSKTSSNSTLVPAANIQVTGTGATRTVTITPAASKTGTATITLTVGDPSGAAASDTFVLTVTS
jgi:hypothetical protein